MVRHRYIPFSRKQQMRYANRFQHLACDWLDDVGSQLFYVSGFEAGELRAPSSCSYVDLVMVPVDDFRVYGPREPKRTRLKKD